MHWTIGLMSRVFANDQVIPNTQKMVLNGALLNNQLYKVKWNNPGKGVALFPTPRCNSY